MKREAGANPARTRRCMSGVLFCPIWAHWRIEILWEEKSRMLMLESEDLPVISAQYHEDLVNAEKIQVNALLCLICID